MPRDLAGELLPTRKQVDQFSRGLRGVFTSRLHLAEAGAVNQLDAKHLLIIALSCCHGFLLGDLPGMMQGKR